MTEVDHSVSRKVKDVIAGFTGGAVQVLIGQPFDLVKVRMQTGQFQSPVTAFRVTLTKEGPLAFYKGTLAPLIGVGACVSIQMAAFHEAKRRFMVWNNSAELTYPQLYAAGAVAGVANTVVASPVEQIRILLQTQGSGEARRYAGPADAVRKIYSRHGVSGIWRGSAVTALREAQAYGVWFLTYEYLMKLNLKHFQPTGRREDVPTWKLMLFGALAGETLWLSSYPLDVIKSKYQSDGFDGPAQKYRNARDAMSQTWKTQGMAGFWRGIAPTLLRAIPCSAGTFATVELTLRLL